MNLKLTPGRLYGAAIVALSIWILHGFVHGRARGKRDRDRELAAVHMRSRRACASASADTSPR